MSIIAYNTCGADYDTATAPQEWDSWGGGAVGLDGVVGYFMAGGDSYNTYMNVANKSEVYVGVRCVTNGSSAGRWLKIGDMGITMSGNTIVYNGVATPPVVVAPTSTWHYYEFHIVKSAVDGVFEVRVDGNLVYSANTINTGAALITNVALANGAWQDFVVLDTAGPAPNNNFIGDVRVRPYFPINDVGTPQWTNGFGGQNSDQVNARIPPGDAHFLTSDVVGDFDLYTKQNLPGDSVAVYAVCPKLNMRKNIGGARTVGALLDNGATTWVGADLYVAGGTYLEYTEIYNLSPFTGLAWTPTEVNTLRIGQQIKA